VPTLRGQDLIGKIISACLLEELIGSGGSSAVFLAQQYTPERKVAVKIFLPRSNMNVQMQKDFYRRFLHEAEAASELDHPHILPIYSYGEQDGFPYIIMPYLPGGTLYDYISRHGPLSLDEARLYLGQIASALDYSHLHECVHCDVKPANILLDGQGNGILSDFGIARALQLAPSPVSYAARDPEILLGTPNYISPEQALGQRLDGRSDVYSLGVTLFFLLAGRAPFQADSSIAMALMHVHEKPPSLHSLRPDISPRIDNVISKALAKAPDMRFQSAGELSAAVDRVVSVPGGLNRPGKAITYPGGGIMITSSKPTIYVQPAGAKRYTFKPSWIVFAAMLLLALILGVTGTAALVSSRIAQNTSHLQATVPAGIGSGIFADSLADNQQAWPASSTFFFVNGQYHIQNKSSRNVALALYAERSFANLRLTVTMLQVHGLHDASDYYGVVLRSATDQSHYYLFEISAWNGGQYAFLRYNGQYRTLAVGLAPSLLTRAGQSNAITVEAAGNTFTFFVNGRAVGTPITDSSNSALTSGEIGLYVEEQDAEVAFSHLRIDILK
jgi:serine/threonine protein kinase